MALRRLSTSSIQTNGKSSKLWDQTTFQSGMFALATVDFVTGVSSVTFAGIPQDYTHLQIRYALAGSVPGSGESYSNLRFNSDSTAGNYCTHKLSGDGATATSAASTSQAQINIPHRVHNTSDFIRSVGIVDILDYTSTTKVKTVKILAGFDTNNVSSGVVSLTSGAYCPGLNTTPAPAAITSLSISMTTYGYASNGIVALYGIKSA